MFLLDTNVVSELVRRPTGLVKQRLDEHRVRAVTSVIVTGELRFGLAKNPSARLHRRVELVLADLPVLPLTHDVGESYGHVRAVLEGKGTPIGNNDLWIAAHALALDATLVTDNVREFQRVEGLAVVNWLRG